MVTSGDIVLYYLLVVLASGGKEDYIEQIIGNYWAPILYHFASALHFKYRYIHMSCICICSIRYTTRFCGDLTALKHTVVVHGGHLLFIIEKGSL